jgi:hypothetical protein
MDFHLSSIARHEIIPDSTLPMRCTPRRSLSAPDDGFASSFSAANSNLAMDIMDTIIITGPQEKMMDNGKGTVTTAKPETLSKPTIGSNANLPHLSSIVKSNRVLLPQALGCIQDEDWIQVENYIEQDPSLARQEVTMVVKEKTRNV